MAVDTFLKLGDDIQGESTDDKHKNEIEILSWSWGESNIATGASGGGRGAGKVTMQDFMFTMRANKASPKLALACATGQHVPEAVLTLRKAGGEQQEYFKILLKECLVTSFSTGGSAGDEVPMDQFSLNFTKIEWEYKPQKPDGTLDSPVKAGYDLAKNVKV
jgi:type VI secretion system secreted protein Hcp